MTVFNDDWLEERIELEIYEAIRDYNHPQAVDPVGNAVRAIMEAVNKARPDEPPGAGIHFPGAEGGIPYRTPR